MNALAPAAATTGVNGVALTVLILLFALVTGMGFWASTLAPGRQHGVPRRVGPGWPQVRHLGDVVPPRRRPLHGIHVHRGPGGDVRPRLGQRVLRRALHDRALPDHLHLHVPALVGQPPARLRDPGGLRQGPLRLARALARGGGHRNPRDDALHRPPAGRHPGGARGGRRRRQQRLRQGPAAVHRVRPAGGLHLLQRSARPGDHRLRQGRADLPRHHRRRHLPAVEGRRLGRTSSARPRPRWPSRAPPTRPSLPARSSRTASSTGPTRRSRSARRWRCSCTPTRSRQPCRARAATRSAATPRSCRPTRSCSACWPCSAGWPSRPAPSRSASTASRTRSWSSPSCSRTCSRAGSPVWPSRRWRSELWSRRRSCRSRQPTPSPATSTGTGSSPTPRTPRRPRSASWFRCWSRLLRSSSSSPWTSRTRSTSSSSVASGSCRPSRRSSSGSTPAGSTGGHCSVVGRSAWSTARSRPTTSSTRPPRATSAAPWR